MGTSKLKTNGAAARTPVTPMVQVPADGSVAPVTGTWSAVTAVTGNLRAGTSAVAAVTRDGQRRPAGSIAGCSEGVRPTGTSRDGARTR